MTWNSSRLYRTIPALMVCFGVAASAAMAQSAAPQPSPADLAKAEALRKDLRRMIEVARDRVFPALVNIHVVTVGYGRGKEIKGRSVGSGTIIDKEGYVLTNQHVTDNGKKFRCILSDKQEISAELVGEDPLTDLAILKLRLSELKSPAQPLPVAQFGNSDELEIGDQVMAMGSPHALSRSVTLGIVANASRVFAGAWGSDDDVEESEREGFRTGLFTRWIQHDALINPGNSGGPLINLKGEVIGVNELGGSGMGFAIPSNLARTVAKALIEHGEVPRSTIEVSLKSIEKTGFEQGVLVNSVVKGGPADKAGIQAGDVILKLNKDPVTVRFTEEIPPLLRRIAELPIGTALPVVYSRDGSIREATITTEKLKRDRGDEAAFRAWGLTALEITAKMARDWKLDDTNGVLVSSLKGGGPAALAEPPISVGDVIRSVDGSRIKNLDAFIKLYGEIMARDPLPEYLLVEFDRSGKNQVTLLKPKPDKEEDPPREVAKAWIGVDTQPVLTKLAVKLGHPDVRGYRVTRVYPGTNAANTDLKVGDIITMLNKDKLSPRGMEDKELLNRLVRKLDIDDTATLTVFRDGEKKPIKVALERTRMTASEARHDMNRDFDLTVREVTFFDRDENRWDNDVKGVIVSAAESAGWAGLGGVRADDLIQRIDDNVITDLDTYRKVMDKIAKDQPKRVVFVVLRGVRTHYQFVEPDWKPSEEGNKPKGDDKPEIDDNKKKEKE